MAPWYAGDQTLAARAVPIATRYVGRRTGFVDEDQAFQFQAGLAGAPLLATQTTAVAECMRRYQTNLCPPSHLLVFLLVYDGSTSC